MLDQLPEPLIIEIMRNSSWKEKKSLSITSKRYHHIFQTLEQNCFKALPLKAKFQIFDHLAGIDLIRFGQVCNYNQRSVKFFKLTVTQKEKLNIIISKYRNQPDFNKNRLIKNGMEILSKNFLTIPEILHIRSRKLFLLFSDKALEGMNNGVFTAKQLLLLNVDALQILLENFDKVNLQPEILETYIGQFNEKGHLFLKNPTAAKNFFENNTFPESRPKT